MVRLPQSDLFSLFADEWPRLSFAMLHKGKPAAFRLFPVSSYVVVRGAGSFLPPDTFRLAEDNMLMPRDLLDPGVALLCAASTVRAAAAVEASVAAKVPAVAAAKSLPDRLDGWQPKRKQR
jgi:hypothetical protein